MNRFFVLAKTLELPLVRNTQMLDTATLLINVFGYAIIILLGPTFFVLIHFSWMIFPVLTIIRSEGVRWNVLTAGIIAVAATHGAVSLIAIVHMLLILMTNVNTWIKSLW